MEEKKPNPNHKGGANINDVRHKFTEEDRRKARESIRNNARKKGEIKRALVMLLEADINDNKGNTRTGAEALALVAFKKALNGSEKFMKFVRDTAGQAPVQKIAVAEIEPQAINEVEAAILGTESESVIDIETVESVITGDTPPDMMNQESPENDTETLEKVVENDTETTLKSIKNDIETIQKVVENDTKKTRGRPRKTATAKSKPATTPKKKRGRPRKNENAKK